MKSEQMREIADAILYEGYLLYPYRHSSIKNRQRWTFGVVYPRTYSEAQKYSNEPWQMRTECLIQSAAANTELDVTVRFLHLLTNITEAAQKRDPSPYEAWEEGVAREVTAEKLSLQELVTASKQVEIRLPEHHLAEPSVRAEENSTIRSQKALSGVMRISAEQIQERLYKVSIVVENTQSLEGVQATQRAAVLLQSFVSTHLLLQVQGGSFISLLDPPETLIEVAKACNNAHTWPVLIGDEGERNTMLSSPIILYDYPKIAPESIGTLFDGTEIDEILTLRIMTLTDEEKQEMRQTDERANALLERTESMTAQDLMQLHGVVRNLQNVDEEEVRK